MINIGTVVAAAIVFGRSRLGIGNLDHVGTGSLKNAQKQSWIFIEFANRIAFEGSSGFIFKLYVKNTHRSQLRAEIGSVRGEYCTKRNPEDTTAQNNRTPRLPNMREGNLQYLRGEIPKMEVPKIDVLVNVHRSVTLKQERLACRTHTVLIVT
jgi:hypothetical protein